MFNIFLSSLLPLIHKLLQNPNLSYLFRTLNLTHTLLNASNPQLAKDCWICLSITPLGDSALPTSILDWTTGNMSLHHSYHGEPLFVSYLICLHTTDQIRNSDILLESLLTELHSFNEKPPIGGSIAQSVTLLQPAPFCISRNSWNTSYDQPVGTIPNSTCNHTSTLLFATGKAVYNVSGPTGHALTFTGWFPSAYSSTSPITGAILAGSLDVLEWTIKTPLDSSSPSTSAAVLMTPGLFFLCGMSTYLCLPTNWIGTCTLVYSSPDILIAPKDQPLPIPLIHKWIKWAIHIIPLLIGLRIVAGIGIGTVGLTTSIQNYQTLSKDLSDSLQEIAQGLITIQSSWFLGSWNITK